MKDPWVSLRSFTQARIAQGQCGSGLPTDALLDFQLAHAAARDAVLKPWSPETSAASLEAKGHQSLILSTKVLTREQYLLRPDDGRSLSNESRHLLESMILPPVDIALILTNGLSSTAVEAHGVPLIEEIHRSFTVTGFVMAPIVLIANGRVAVADEIGSLLNARMSLIVVGERPGLSAADSVGAYLTFGPRVGRTDAERNCISNIRPPDGLSFEEAAIKMVYLCREGLRRGLTGVQLKDDMPAKISHLESPSASLSSLAMIANDLDA